MIAKGASARNTGSHICEHNRQRSRCKECLGGTSPPQERVQGLRRIEHMRAHPPQHTCKECLGGSCPHKRIKSQCKDCGGSANIGLRRGARTAVDRASARISGDSEGGAVIRRHVRAGRVVGRDGLRGGCARARREIDNNGVWPPSPPCFFDQRKRESSGCRTSKNPTRGRRTRRIWR